MKIIYLDLDDIKNPLLGAGQARATKEVGSVLASRGHTLTSICSKYPNYRDRTENGIKYVHIGIGTPFLQLNNAVYILALPFTVMRLKADIIIECFSAPISTLFSPLFTKIPVVALPSMFNAKEFSQKYHLPFEWFEKFGMQFYKYIMPYSAIDESKSKKLNPKIITKIIPQGVGESFFATKKQTPKFILYFGRLDINQKGIDLLLEAYAKIVTKIKYPLVLAGHGVDRNRIIKKVQDLGLEHHVSLIGPIYDQKKAEVFAQALFVAFPSRHDEICLATLEVLAAGLPLVCFDLPESQWLSPKVALKAKQFNIGEYAKLILDLSNNPKLVNTMSQASRALAKNYRWDKVAAEFESFFKYILKQEQK